MTCHGWFANFNMSMTSSVFNIAGYIFPIMRALTVSCRTFVHCFITCESELKFECLSLAVFVSICGVW